MREESHADELRAAIERAGGLHTVADLARRWGVTKSRVHELAQTAGFPDPLIRIGKSDVYIGIEADEFRSRTKPPGRPVKP